MDAGYADVAKAAVDKMLASHLLIVALLVAVAAALLAAPRLPEVDKVKDGPPQSDEESVHRGSKGSFGRLVFSDAGMCISL